MFARVPETKHVKNRLHVDLSPDNQQVEVARAETLGARQVDVGQTVGVPWIVLADPEGNKLCILVAEPRSEDERPGYELSPRGTAIGCSVRHCLHGYHSGRQ